MRRAPSRMPVFGPMAAGLLLSLLDPILLWLACWQRVRLPGRPGLFYRDPSDPDRYLRRDLAIRYCTDRIRQRRGGSGLG